MNDVYNCDVFDFCVPPTESQTLAIGRNVQMKKPSMLIALYDLEINVTWTRKWGHPSCLPQRSRQEGALIFFPRFF